MGCRKKIWPTEIGYVLRTAGSSINVQLPEFESPGCQLGLHVLDNQVDCDLVLAAPEKVSILKEPKNSRIIFFCLAS